MLDQVANRDPVKFIMNFRPDNPTARNGGSARAPVLVHQKMTSEARKIFLLSILPAFEADKRSWILKARDAAKQIAEQFGNATIDDVREVCPPPADADPRIMGAVFAREFQRVGFTQSERKVCHGRNIGIFKLINAA